MIQLIRIHLDPLQRQTVRGFVNPNIFHAAIEASVQNGKSRVLWRIDELSGQSYLLLLTHAEIDTQFLIDQFGFSNEKAQFVDYTKLLERVDDGTKWIFRLTANPVHHAKNDKTERDGKILAHVTPEQQMNWLILHSEKRGFHVDVNKSQVVSTRWIKFRKRDSGITIKLKEATFEGVLTVTNAELFKKVLSEGLGRGKAYGMGLLTIIPCHE